MAEIVIRLGKQIEYLNSIYVLFDTVAKIWQIDDSELFKLKLAVSEGVTNAIENAETFVEIKIVSELEKNRLKIFIFNDGIPFVPPEDYFELPEIYASENRGIFLMSKYMDEIDFIEKKNGTMLYLMKQIRR